MRQGTVLGINASVAAFALVAAQAVVAQSWPAKPVRIVVPFPPGGGVDFFARVTATKLQEQLGQQMVVENRSGASGMIGADAVAKAPPDGYTTLFASVAELTILQHLYPKIAYDAKKDLAPVTYAVHAAVLCSVHPSIPARSLKELIALARARPGQLTYAAPGIGGVHHLSGELLKYSAKLDIVMVPYKGAGPAVIDMVGGQVTMGFTALPSSLPHARSGRLRAIAVTSGQRSEVAPDLPTFTELGFPAIDLVSWYAVLLPARTPAEIVERLNTEVNRAVRSADVKARLLQQGVEVVGTTPDQLATLMQSEISRYGKVIKDAGIKGE